MNRIEQLRAEQKEREEFRNHRMSELGLEGLGRQHDAAEAALTEALEGWAEQERRVRGYEFRWKKMRERIAEQERLLERAAKDLRNHHGTVLGERCNFDGWAGPTGKGPCPTCDLLADLDARKP